ALVGQPWPGKKFYLSNLFNGPGRTKDPLPVYLRSAGIVKTIVQVKPLPLFPVIEEVDVGPIERYDQPPRVSMS
ncbi:hypothetical protein Tco_0342123, partial [Tanacetum coccineum]